MPNSYTATTDHQIGRIRHYQQILLDFSQMAPDSSDVDSLLQLASVQAARGIGIDHTKVLRYRPEVGDLLIVAGVGWQPGVVGHASLGTDLGSAPGQALQTRQPVVVPDLPAETEFRYPSVLREHGIVSALNVPVGVDGAVWGVLEVDSSTPRDFSRDDANFLQTMGNILGHAIDNRLRLHRATEEYTGQQVLLSEMHHRNKNDLQMILSLLTLQRRKQTDPTARQGIMHVMDRVAAISLAHDQLAVIKGKGRVELSDYLTSLCGNLQRRKEGVLIETELARQDMPHERAVPLGLIVNELVTNALKHAFPGDRHGVIRVLFSLVGTGEAMLCVRDDGVGMGPPRPGSSGTDLLRLLVRQVGGEMRQEEQEHGAGVCVQFPLVA